MRACRRSSSAPILASAAERTGLHLVTDKINQAQQEPLRHLRASSLSFPSTNMNIMIIISPFKKQQRNTTSWVARQQNNTKRECVGVCGPGKGRRCLSKPLFALCGEQAGCRRRSKQASRGCAKHRRGNGARGRAAASWQSCTRPVHSTPGIPSQLRPRTGPRARRTRPCMSRQLVMLNLPDLSGAAEAPPNPCANSLFMSVHSGADQWNVLWHVKPFPFVLTPRVRPKTNVSGAKCQISVSKRVNDEWFL